MNMVFFIRYAYKVWKPNFDRPRDDETWTLSYLGSPSQVN